MLSYAAEVLGADDLRKAARQLAHAADVLPGTVSQLEHAAGKVSQLSEADGQTAIPQWWQLALDPPETAGTSRQATETITQPSSQPGSPSRPDPISEPHRVTRGPSAAVSIAPVVYIKDVDLLAVVVDRVPDPVLAAAGTPLTLERGA